MSHRLLTAFQSAALLMLMSQGFIKGIFTLPNSVLLFGRSVPGVPKEELLVVSATGTVTVQAPTGFWGQGFNALPALSPNADLVAWGLAPTDNPETGNFKSVLGVYSLPEKSWRTYGDFCRDGIGSKVFSPDGRRIAFASKAGSSSNNSRCFDNQIVLQILDITKGKFTPVRYEGLVENARISWSPDGNELVIETCCSTSSNSQIAVINLSSGGESIIAEGTDPSWSPKGDWISYEDQKKQKCILVHPDGTGTKVVRDLEKGLGVGHWVFLGGAVWSPDGTKLLFDEEEVDSGGRVTVLELPNGKLTKMSRNGKFLYGWAREAGE